MTLYDLYCWARQRGIDLRDLLPTNWYNRALSLRTDADDAPLALIAYASERARDLGLHLDSSQPTHEFWGPAPDGGAYLLYEDGSLWFINSAEDEVWREVADYCTDSLIPALQSCNHDWQGAWDDQEDGSWVVQEMDRQLLKHLYGDRAREFAGFPAGDVA